MGTIWIQIGFIRWPLTFSLVVVLALTVTAAVRLYGRAASADLRTKAWLDAILFWGGFGLVAGVLGTVVGVVVAADSIERAGAVAPTLVWGGIRVAMLSSVYGLLILVVGSLSWFVLQLRWRMLEAREGRPA